MAVRVTSRQFLVFSANLAVLGAAVGLWQGLVAAGVLDPFWVSTPWRVLHSLATDLRHGSILSDLLATLEVAALGFAIALIVALPIVGVITSSRFAAAVLEPFIDILYAVPKIALVPALILWLGIGALPRVVLVVLLVAFVFIYNLRAGMREVSQSLVDAVEIMGGGRWDILLHVRVPTLVSYAVSAARVAGPTALAGAVFAEFFGAQHGIGLVIFQAGEYFHPDQLFAAVAVLMPVAYALDWSLRKLDATTSAWRDE